MTKNMKFYKFNLRSQDTGLKLWQEIVFEIGFLWTIGIIGILIITS